MLELLMMVKRRKQYLERYPDVHNGGLSTDKMTFNDEEYGDKNVGLHRNGSIVLSTMWNIIKETSCITGRIIPSYLSYNEKLQSNTIIHSN
jgi:hypothetical protein